MPRDEVEERCAASRDDTFNREHILQRQFGQGEERSAVGVPLHEKFMNHQEVNGVGRVKDNDDGPVETLGTQDLIRRAAAQQLLVATILKKAMCGVSPTSCAATANFACTQRRDNETATQRKSNEASPTTRTSSPISTDSQDGAGYKGVCTWFDPSSLNCEERGAGRTHLPDIPEEQLSLMASSSSLPPSTAPLAGSIQTGPRHADWMRETWKENVFSTYGMCTTAFSPLRC